MLEELEQLIKFIQTEYNEFNTKWQGDINYHRINLKDYTVRAILDNKDILNTIFNYREFINQNNIKLIMDFKQFNSQNAKVNTRAKNKNSIEYKIENYVKNHNEGKVPINKCFNDLFGIRIICEKDLTYGEIKKLLDKKFPQLKCTDSSKQEYKATHIYFRNGSYNFPWELQVWNKCDEENNINSHGKYKQDYVKWEKENKGGAN